MDSGCEEYGDFISISTDVEQGGTYDMSFTTGYGNQYFRVWIDYNDDLLFSAEELVVDNPVLEVVKLQEATQEVFRLLSPQMHHLAHI